MKIKKKVRILTVLRDYCEKLKIDINSRTKDDDNYEGFMQKNQTLIYEVFSLSELFSGVDCPDSIFQPSHSFLSSPSDVSGIFTGTGIKQFSRNDAET